MPSEGLQNTAFKEILTYEEIIRLVGITVGFGIKKIRITGGEPLLRKDLPFLIESLNEIRDIEDISLTTNGVLLKRFARTLASSGLQRVNISLDSLNPDRYREITRGGNIEDVFDGIYAAEEAGLTPIRINMVPIRGINSDEIEDFARLTQAAPYQVRFIEFMPITPRKMWAKDKYVSADEITARVASIMPLEAVQTATAGPARYYRFRNAPGVIGFISPISNHFCSSCSRIRLTSDGKLRPCLFSATEVDIKAALRSGARDADIAELVRHAVELKPERHRIGLDTLDGIPESMSRIGG
jgi:cyclic pyranopterin phosphate synthase